MPSLTEKIARAVARGQTSDPAPDRAQIVAHCDSVGVDVLTDAAALALKCRSCSRIWYPVPILNRLEPNYCRCPGKCNARLASRAQRESSRQTAAGGMLLALRKAIARAELAGMSRTSIADAAGVHRGQLARLMSGASVCRLDTADAIARAIGQRLALVKAE